MLCPFLCLCCCLKSFFLFFGSHVVVFGIPKKIFVSFPRRRKKGDFCCWYFSPRGSYSVEMQREREREGEKGRRHFLQLLKVHPPLLSSSRQNNNLAPIFLMILDFSMQLCFLPPPKLWETFAHYLLYKVQCSRGYVMKRKRDVSVYPVIQFSVVGRKSQSLHLLSWWESAKGLYWSCT